ncbi:MAG: dipeptidase [Ignavibacteriaceae bacterium]
MERVVDYINSNIHTYIEELKDFLRIPSISTSEQYKNDMLRGADFVAGKLKDAGLKNVKVIKTPKHPLVYADWLNAPGKPTVLIYGHYDVQPVDPISLWDSLPFEPVIKNGKIYARGATDDKGQVYMHIKSVEAYLKTTGKLPLNVKFIIEGEEEVGSDSLENFINTNTKTLRSDAILISDTALYGPGIPTITYGLRGLAYLELQVTGPNRDLHSGTFGGTIANPINVLAEIISKLMNKNGHINIPGFYDDVVKVTKKEKENFKSLGFSEKKFAKEIGVKKLKGEKGYTTLERSWTRPTLDCNGINGGFTEEGAKTVLPSKAMAKISMRLVPNQDPNKIAKLFTKYIKSITPPTVSLKIKNLHGGYPFLTPLDDKAMVAGANAMTKAFGKKTVFMREGGSIPIVTVFTNFLQEYAK